MDPRDFLSDILDRLEEATKTNARYEADHYAIERKARDLTVERDALRAERDALRTEVNETNRSLAAARRDVDAMAALLTTEQMDELRKRQQADAIPF